MISSDDLLSDHRAIEFTIECDVNAKIQPKNYKFDLADWDTFKTTVKNNIDLNVQFDSNEEIDEAVSNLTISESVLVQSQKFLNNCYFSENPLISSLPI